MAQSLKSLLDTPIIELDWIDSTNKYAMQLIDADTAQEGWTIVARQQSQGRGQRGRRWLDVAGASLLMSVVCQPNFPLREQFAFSACVAVAIAETILELYENWDVRIKWPNDIIINDKKAGGLLIENVLRGNLWPLSIIGLGLNVGQTSFSFELPFATSLKMASGKDFPLKEIMLSLRTAILKRTNSRGSAKEIMELYNSYLYRRGQQQRFEAGGKEWSAVVVAVGVDGRLEVQLQDGQHMHFTHGSLSWKWD